MSCVVAFLLKKASKYNCRSFYYLLIQPILVVKHPGWVVKGWVRKKKTQEVFEK
jgi:hypothetical protein